IEDILGGDAALTSRGPGRIVRPRLANSFPAAHRPKGGPHAAHHLDVARGRRDPRAGVRAVRPGSAARAAAADLEARSAAVDGGFPAGADRAAARAEGAR